MSRVRKICWSRLTGAVLLGASLSPGITMSPLAAAETDSKAVLHAEQADESFKYQGEYAGDIVVNDDSVGVGVQVVALGDGKFKVTGYPGGLPGDGWTGEERIAAEGTLEGDEVQITSTAKGGRAVIRDGKMMLTIGDMEVGSLAKVERESKTLGKKPPEGATVLYTGEEEQLKNFKGARLDEGHLREGFQTVEEFGDHTLHLEFLLSYMPQARGQQRSNSGVYLQGRYEVQVLDSFGLDGADNECGGIYKASAPRVNMCYPPLRWQTYDIDFTAAKFNDAGEQTEPAKITVRHNGVMIHADLKLESGTPGGVKKAGPGPGPLFVQNHNNPVWFRNVWVAKK